MTETMPTATAQRHAAPIKFANLRRDAACRARCGAAIDNDAYEQHDAQRLRTEQLLRAAHTSGQDAGERWGFTAGYRWGLVCGFTSGAFCIALLWVLWAPLQTLLAQWGLL